MSDPKRDEPSEGEEVVEDAPRNPFDNPLFLPVLLLGLSVWFGYDGWFNADPKMQEHLTFNRVGFFVLIALGAWFGYKARKEIRERKGEP